MAGGSHTAFDTGAFTTGALSGAGVLASAFGAGLTRFRETQARRWTGWTIEQLRAALECSELFRARERETSQALRRVIETQRTQIARLERELATERAHNRRRS
jgi:uncharacterized protein HemX